MEKLVQFTCTMLAVLLCMVTAFVSSCPTACSCESPDTVDCSRRKLTAIPSGIPASTKILWLGDNQITRIEVSALKHLTSLEVLHLYVNQIKEIGVAAFHTLKKLKVLHLKYNKISTIPDGTFDSLINLEELNLGGNNIQAIPGGAFHTLKKLKYLWLKNNKISTIPDGAFHTLKKLERLYLYANKISTIPDGAFDSLINLVRLRLYGNPLVCCGTKKAISAVIQRNIRFLSGTCTSANGQNVDIRQIVTKVDCGIDCITTQNIVDYVTEVVVKVDDIKKDCLMKFHIPAGRCYLSVASPHRPHLACPDNKMKLTQHNKAKTEEHCFGQHDSYKGMIDGDFDLQFVTDASKWKPGDLILIHIVLM